MAGKPWVGGLLVTIFTTVSVQAAEPGMNCWGKPADPSRIQELRAKKSLMSGTHPFTNIYTALSRIVPEPVEMLYDESADFNAYAQNWGGRTIVMNRGVMLHQFSSEDAAAMIACHELGHHFGGRPQSWGGMSYEGQSDYYGAQACFRYWIQSSPPVEVTDTEVVEYCEKTHGKRDQFCLRHMDASLRLSRIIHDLKKHAKPYLNQTDPSVVRRTVSAHPQAQCRLDTYKAGYIVLENGSQVGDLRPACWFNSAGVPLSIAQSLD